MGFRLQGAAGSRIIAAADMDSVLNLNGVAYSRFGGFEISGTAEATVQRAIHLYWDPATAARSTTLNRFHDIDIHALRYVTGIELGRTDDGNQVDNTTLRDVSIVGNWEAGDENLWQHGLVVGDGKHANNLIHNAYGLHVDHHRYNVDVRASQLAWFGGHLGGPSEADIRFAGTSYLRVDGVRSENSQRLLITNGGAKWASNVTLNDITWRAEDIAPDGKFIRWSYGGVLRLNNIQINRPTVAPKVSIEAPAPALVLADGVTVTGDSPASAGDLFALGTNGRVVARGVTRTDVAGIVTSVDDYSSP